MNAHSFNMEPPLPESDAEYVRRLIEEGFMQARTALRCGAEVLIHGSSETLASLQRAEERLDELDREIDLRVTSAVTHASPEQARELLACLKSMIALERIGDLALSFGTRSESVRMRIGPQDLEDLVKIVSLLDDMLAGAERAFMARDLDAALRVIHDDSELDRRRNLIVIRHTEPHRATDLQESLHVVGMAQALERAGDHVKNLAEEICFLTSGQTVRHLMRASDKPLEQMFLDRLFARHSIRRPS